MRNTRKILTFAPSIALDMETILLQYDSDGEFAKALDELILNSTGVSIIERKRTPEAKGTIHGKGLSDEALSELLKDFAPLNLSDFPDIEDEAYSAFVERKGGSLPKNVESWL